MKSIARAGFAAIVALLGLVLAAAVLSVPDMPGRLPGLVMEHLQATGVEHPVTAVLLNYRGYDTLLELAVLLFALLGAWSFSEHVEGPPLQPAGRLLREFMAFLVPVLIVMAVYLWWIGAYSPGGAFQAGAVLAGAGVMLSLVDPHWRGGRLDLATELLILPGVVVFVLVGMACVVYGGHFLEYPEGAAGTLIVLIEGCATVSIAVTLQTLFAGTARIGEAS